MTIYMPMIPELCATMVSLCVVLWGGERSGSNISQERPHKTC